VDLPSEFAGVEQVIVAAVRPDGLMVDARRIDDPADRCPGCGGYGMRGCGSAWHADRADTHCSPACQCRDEMRDRLRWLSVDLAAAESAIRTFVGMVDVREHDWSDAQRAAIRGAIHRPPGGDADG
jgi:hypothetical protein